MSNMRKGRPQGGAMGAADPKALGRAVKKLFEYYPVMAPLTMFCILFSSVVSSILTAVALTVGSPPAVFLTTTDCSAYRSPSTVVTLPI